MTLQSRKALLPDAPAIHALIQDYARETLLLPRTLAELCENVRDFTVVEDDGQVIACGALHLYGPHLAEVRSIAVARDRQGQGIGSVLMRALLKEADDHQTEQVCLFTRAPEFFAKVGFVAVPHQSLPDKIYKDCQTCPMFTKCDEVAMVYADGRSVEAVLRWAEQKSSESLPLLPILAKQSR
ncbi:MAG: N-acetyltransferase [Candidatus Korobacteraceae bacterium]